MDAAALRRPPRERLSRKHDVDTGTPRVATHRIAACTFAAVGHDRSRFSAERTSPVLRATPLSLTQRVAEAAAMNHAGCPAMLALALIAALSACTQASPAEASPPRETSTAVPAPLAAAARAFLASLDAAARRDATAPFDDGERSNWTYLPGGRDGIALEDFDASPRAAAFGLVDTGLGRARCPARARRAAARRHAARSGAGRGQPARVPARSRRLRS